MLALPQNRTYVTLLRAAKAWPGTDPLEMFLPPDAGDAELRRRLRSKLKIGLQLLEDETCPQCGQPIWWCHATLNTVQFDVETSVCYADAAIEKWKHDVGWGEKNGLNEPGGEPYAVLKMVGGGRRPTRLEGLESIG